MTSVNKEEIWSLLTEWFPPTRYFVFDKKGKWDLRLAVSNARLHRLPLALIHYPFRIANLVLFDR